MKLVIDTNVLIAAFIAKGMCSTVVEHCLIVHSPITSDFILNFILTYCFENSNIYHVNSNTHL